jgi:hypothetical protein
MNNYDDFKKKMKHEEEMELEFLNRQILNKKVKKLWLSGYTRKEICDKLNLNLTKVYHLTQNK